jgi:hypothetical protein
MHRQTEVSTIAPVHAGAVADTSDNQQGVEMTVSTAYDMAAWAEQQADLAGIPTSSTDRTEAIDLARRGWRAHQIAKHFTIAPGAVADTSDNQ